MRQIIILQAVFSSIGLFFLYRGARLRRKGSPLYTAKRGGGLMIQGAALLLLALFPHSVTLGIFVVLHPVGMSLERIYRPKMTIWHLVRMVFNAEKLAPTPPKPDLVAARKDKLIEDAFQSFGVGIGAAALAAVIFLAAALVLPGLDPPTPQQGLSYFGLGAAGLAYIVFWMDLT